MSTKLPNVRNAGNFPAESVVWFENNKQPVMSPAPGFNAVRMGFKTPKKTDVAKRENFMALIPCIKFDDLGSKPEVEWVEALIADCKAEFGRKVADSELPFDVLIDTAKLIAAYNDTSRDSSGRKVTKETIGEYYVDSLAEFVIAAAMKKNSQAKSETLERISEGYREMFQKLTGYGVNHNENQCILMTRILVESKAEGEMAEWLTARITKIEAALKVTDEELENSI
jgi:hypothetical protein